MMLPNQVHNFIENYCKYLNEVYNEIPEEIQERIISYFIDLACYIDGVAKETAGCSSRFRKLELGFCKEIEGPLKGPKKFEFIWLIRRNSYELLTSDSMRDGFRFFQAVVLCLTVHISAEIISQWMPFEDFIEYHHNKNKNKEEKVTEEYFSRGL